MTVNELVFVGLNGRVIALQRDTGDLVWKWAPKTTTAGFVAFVVDGDRLFVSDNGYIYCLDAVTGEVLWHNPLTGFGTGIAMVATATAAGGQPTAAAAAMAAQQAAQSASSAAIIASS
jgi:outer membrane protein assembly factor BamB